MYSDLSELIVIAFGPFAQIATAGSFAGLLVIMIIATFIKIIRRESL